jgi:aromatic-L-amino-acid decarboxylase
MDYGVALGRRFRALKLWFVMRYFGARGLRERIRYHCRLAAGFARRIDGDPAWQRAAPVPFSTVVFRWIGEGAEARVGVPEGDLDLDRANLAIMEAANATGRVFFSHTVLRGRTFLRLSVGNLRTEAEHMERTWGVLSEAVRTVAGSQAGAPTP